MNDACTPLVCALHAYCDSYSAPRLLNKRKMAAATARGGASPRVDIGDTEGFGPVTVLLPCYLPNEQGILRETVAHILEKIEYPATLELILCYNTPTPMLEVEEELAAMAGQVQEQGRSLRVLKVEGSPLRAHLALALTNPNPNPNPSPSPTTLTRWRGRALRRRTSTVPSSWSVLRTWSSTMRTTMPTRTHS